MPGGWGGSGHCVGDIRAGACLMQLPERVYPSLAAGVIGCVPRLCLPGMREVDPFLRQYSGFELAYSSRPLPELLGRDLSQISCCRALYRAPLCFLLVAFRIIAGNAEMRRS